MRGLFKSLCRALLCSLGMALLASPASAMSSADYYGLYLKGYDGLSARQQADARANMEAFLDAQLAGFAGQLEQAGCLSSLYKNDYVEPQQHPGIRCTAGDKGKEAAFSWVFATQAPKGNGPGSRKISKKEQLEPFWPANFDELVSLLEKRLAPLASRKFTKVYDPFHFRRISGTYQGITNRTDVTITGYEFLLRDGRTILSLQSLASYHDRMCDRGDCWGGDSYSHAIRFALLDVRRPPPVINSDYERGEDPIFGTPYDTELADALYRWSDNRLFRRISPELLDPVKERALEIPEAMQQSGIDLANLRWYRMVAAANAHLALGERQRQNFNAANGAILDRSADSYRRQRAEQRAQTASSGGYAGYQASLGPGSYQTCLQAAFTFAARQACRDNWIDRGLALGAAASASGSAGAAGQAGTGRRAAGAGGPVRSSGASGENDGPAGSSTGSGAAQAKAGGESGQGSGGVGGIALKAETPDMSWKQRQEEQMKRAAADKASRERLAAWLQAQQASCIHDRDCESRGERAIAKDIFEKSYGGLSGLSAKTRERYEAELKSARSGPAKRLVSPVAPQCASQQDGNFVAFSCTWKIYDTKRPNGPSGAI